MLVDADGAIHGRTPAVPQLSSVGAGDAMLAGFLAGGGKGADALAEALAWGAAAVLQPGSGMPSPMRSTGRPCGWSSTRRDVRICSPCRPDSTAAAQRGEQRGEAEGEERIRMTSTTADLKHREGPGLQARIQRVGGFLAGMIMPNIAAFIAWGLITALFIPTGWAPNEQLAKLVGPMILTLLPVLIGYTGGRLVHGQRGAVVGAVATMGVVVGTDIPMFLGAMIIGPTSAYILKLIDGVIQQRTRAGFEMLVDNFSAGILGVVMAILGLLAIGPIVENLAKWAGSGVDTLVNAGLLPLVSIIVEPAKVLFLNNAINHGVLGPLGVAQALECRQVDPVHDRDEPGPGPGDSPGHLVLRSAGAATGAPGRSSSSSSAASTRSTSRTCWPTRG